MNLDGNWCFPASSRAARDAPVHRSCRRSSPLGGGREVEAARLFWFAPFLSEPQPGSLWGAGVTQRCGIVVPNQLKSRAEPRSFPSLRLTSTSAAAKGCRCSWQRCGCALKINLVTACGNQPCCVCQREADVWGGFGQEDKSETDGFEQL